MRASPSLRPSALGSYQYVRQSCVVSRSPPGVVIAGCPIEGPGDGVNWATSDSCQTDSKIPPGLTRRHIGIGKVIHGVISKGTYPDYKENISDLNECPEILIAPWGAV